MFGTRWLWAALVGSLLGVAAVAIPAAAMISGHAPWFGVPHHDNGPGWSNSTARYAVTFQESGLPNDTVWSVKITGGWGPTPFGPWASAARPAWHHGGFNASNGTTVGFLLPNGTYHYSVEDAQAAGTLYAPSPASGTVQVNGTNTSVAVAFAPLTYYTVSFVETGLPGGTFWNVSLFGTGGSSHGPGGGSAPGWGGGASNGTNGTAVNFSVPSGVYAFQVPEVNASAGVYLADPSTGDVSVNGTNVTVDVAFSLLAYYHLTFVESGLPNGTFWSVALAGNGSGHGGFGPIAAASLPGCGSPGFNGSTNTTVGFTVPDGTYGFSVPNASNGSAVYVPSPANGTVTVNGSNVTVDVSFAALSFYTVTFVESGLPNGTFWAVLLGGDGSGGWWNGSANATVNFTVPNGTYAFDIPDAANCTALFAPAPDSGTVVVDGSNVTVNVTFSQVTFYTVTFEESGLPNGTDWFVAAFAPGDGWQFNQSNNSSVSVLLPNGTFGFSVGALWANGSFYVPEPAFGNVTVAGTALTVDVTFSPAAVVPAGSAQSGPAAVVPR